MYAINKHFFSYSSTQLTTQSGQGSGKESKDFLTLKVLGDARYCFKVHRAHESSDSFSGPG